MQLPEKYSQNLVGGVHRRKPCYYNEETMWFSVPFCWIQEWSSTSCWPYTTLWTLAMLIQVVVRMNQPQKYRTELKGISDLKPNRLSHTLLWRRCELYLSSQIWDCLPPPSCIAVTVFQPCRDQAVRSWVPNLEWVHPNQDHAIPWLIHQSSLIWG